MPGTARRFQDSIADQIRTLLAEAVRERVFIPFDHVFYDMAVRGFKNDRPGLNALRVCLGRKAATVAFFFATNRLFRKSYRSLQFVEEQIVDRGLRGVFVKSGIDTADTKRWRGLMAMSSGFDEFVVGMNVENIRAAHEGLFRKQIIVGSIPYGYAGEPIPGTTTRRGRPQRRVIIDVEAGEVVRRIFDWFVHDRISMAEIVRRLNTDPVVPLSEKNRTGLWTREVVSRMLRCQSYRGCWRYGVDEAVWISSKDYVGKKTLTEPLATEQFDELRLISDEVWSAAQQLVCEEAAKVVGRKPRDGDTAGRPRVLNGLFRCPVHDRKLYVAGVYGKYMSCKACLALPADQRALYSQLPRPLALRKICQTIAEVIRADSTLVDEVAAACRTEVGRLQQPDPGRMAGLRTRIEKFDVRIGFVMRNPGDTEAELAESERILKSLRSDRAAARAELEALQAVGPTMVPDEDEARRMIADMAATFAEVGTSGESRDPGQLRALFDLLTGGRIDLEQAGEPKAKRGWLRGRFRLQLATAINSPVSADPPEVVIDFRDDDPAIPDELVAQVKALFDGGALIKQIAADLGEPLSCVAAALDEWYARTGESRPDGRSRRSALIVKHLAPPGYQAIADQVKELADSGELFDAIASILGQHRAIVRSAWAYWHTSRGLVVPDGRTRRKSLARKARQTNGGQPECERPAKEEEFER